MLFTRCEPKNLHCEPTLQSIPPWYPKIPRKTPEQKRHPKMPGPLTLLPDLNSTRYPVSFPIPDPTWYWTNLPVGHWILGIDPKSLFLSSISDYETRIEIETILARILKSVVCCCDWTDIFKKKRVLISWIFFFRWEIWMEMEQEILSFNLVLWDENKIFFFQSFVLRQGR